MRHLGRVVMAGVVAATVLTFAGPVFADQPTSPTKFDFHVGDSFGGIESPDITAAANGDTLTVVGTGTFDTSAKTASGSLTFTHKSGSGATLATGTITVTGFTTFVFYGCGVIGGATIPSNLCGGRLLVPVHIVGHPVSGGTAELDGVMQITCLVGDHVPKGAREGFRLVVIGLLNFNKPVSGQTLLVSK